jgi:lysophospholipase L1-like esterase
MSNATSFIANRFAPSRPVRRCLYRVLAILLSLVPLLVAEAVCRWVGWGKPAEVADPFVGFDAVRPLFTPDATGQFYETAPDRLVHFRRDQFAVDKPANEFRVFCLGGSTVQGNPYGIETAFSTWLELTLRAADPTRSYRVVNCGGISYASYRLAPIFKELLTYQPDLLILYTGHNEFLEDRTYHPIKWKARWLGRVYAWATSSQFFNACHAGVQSWRNGVTRSTKGFQERYLPPAAAGSQSGVRRAAGLDENRKAESAESVSSLERTQLPSEVDAWLDHYGGLDAYRRDPQWRAGVVDHFEWNLRRMVKWASDVQVPLMLVNPVGNLKDCPPFKFAPGDLSAADAVRFQELWTTAQTTEQVAARLTLLEEAVAIDPQHAAAQYLLGQTYLATGQPAEAGEALLRAKEEDLCPLRMIEPLYERLQRVARETNTPLVDVRARFEQLSSERLVGEPWLVDHVHPSITGHQQIAAGLFEQLRKQGMVRATNGWEARRDVLYQQQLARLTTAYYARGKEHLQGLLRWSQGRSGTPPQAQP